MISTYTHAALPRFAELADRFCRNVTNRDAASPEVQLRELHELLARLYVAALDLPPTSVLCDDGSDDGDPEPSIAHPHDGEGNPIKLEALEQFLGLRRFYREIFDPHSSPEDQEVTGDLLDDFSDIFHDLQRGLRAWNVGDSGKALWEWRFLFEAHWGEHATSAIRALFALCAWHDSEWPAGAA